MSELLRYPRKSGTPCWTGQVSMGSRTLFGAAGLAVAFDRRRLRDRGRSTDPSRSVSAGPKCELSGQDTRVGNWFESDLGH
jgi:hypothetical protein